MVRKNSQSQSINNLKISFKFNIVSNHEFLKVLLLVTCFFNLNLT